MKHNIYNLLIPGGCLVLRENTLSLFSKWRKKIFSNKYHDKAHPVCFTYCELIDIVNKNHFELIYSHRDHYETLKRICFKSRRLFLIAKKPE